MSNNESDFMRGLRTGGTLLENPIPTSLDEWNGQQMAKSWQPGNQQGGGGGGGLAVLIVALAALVVIVPAAIASLPGALGLLALTGVFGRGRAGLEYFDAYKTSFWSLLAYFALSAGCAWLFQQMLASLPPGPFMQNLALGGVIVMDAFNGWSASFGPLPPAPVWAIAGGALMLQVVPLLAMAVIIRSRTGFPYSGGLGFLKALVAALMLAAIGAGLAWLAIHVLLPHADPLEGIGGARPSSLIVPALMATAAVAVAGATVLAPLLVFLSGRKASARPRFGVAWVVAALAMAIAAASALVAFYLFRVGDDGFMLLTTLILPLKGDPGVSWAASMPGFLILAGPGAVTAALIVAMNLYAYRGGGGLLRALFIVTPFGLIASAAAVIALIAIAF